MKIFVDTNIFVYSSDANEPAKRSKARQLLISLKTGADIPVISTQVLQEFFSTVTRKLKVSPADATDELRVMSQLETVIIVPPMIIVATELHARDAVSFWDALIITAAQSAHCAELWSEDMQDGRKFGSVEIVNPLTRR